MSIFRRLLSFVCCLASGGGEADVAVPPPAAGSLAVAGPETEYIRDPTLDRNKRIFAIHSYADQQLRSLRDSFYRWNKKGDRYSARIPITGYDIVEIVFERYGDFVVIVQATQPDSSGFIRWSFRRPDNTVEPATITRDYDYIEITLSTT